MGRKADAIALFQSLTEAPYRFDFYYTLRLLECVYGERPRWGFARRPADEPVRLGQDADLSFAPAPLASFEPQSDDHPPRLLVRLFGLLGPNGPLPIHITDYVRERVREAGDPTFSRFLDVFHHRLTALFYRAWAQAQPHVNRDRPDDDHFTSYIGSFIGVSTPAFRGRDSLPDVVKLFQAGTLSRKVRNADGLAAILGHFFHVPARIQQFIGHWMQLGPQERTYLARSGATLGSGGVLGAQVWDRQHKFRVYLGPLTLSQYESFLPGGRRLTQLVDWVRFYLSFELEWDVRLRLKHNEVPRLALGRGRQLGWTTWLGTRQVAADADDLCLDAERFLNVAGVNAA